MTTWPNQLTRLPSRRAHPGWGRRLERTLAPLTAEYDSRLRTTTMTTHLSPATLRFVVGLLLGFFLGVAACWGFGFFSTRYHPIEESKLCYEALREHCDKLHPQTREYLKARLYWNADVWVPKSWMAGWQLDFGPVDDSNLGGLKPIKDASSTAEVYRDVLIKHGITPKPQ